MNIGPDADTGGRPISLLTPTRPLHLMKEAVAATDIIVRALASQTDIFALVNLPVPANKEGVYTPARIIETCSQTHIQGE